jgi:glyoxylase-like metal-dependent hydrolase (beta-lactamase superfamily II)
VSYLTTAYEIKSVQYSISNYWHIDFRIGGEDMKNQRIAFNLLAASIFCFMVVAPQNSWSSGALPDYPAVKISDHVWVIHGPTELPNPKNKGFMNNLAFVVTGDSVVVIDPGSTVETGRMVLRQIRSITDKAVTHVFATHIHGDHWLGNHAIREAYPSAEFYAHPVMIEQAHSGQAETWVGMMERLTEGASKGTEAVIPDHILKDGQVIKVGDVSFRIYLSEWAHTKTDAMIEIVEDSLLAAGDNVLYKRIARMDDASFRGNIAACEQAMNLKLKHYIPGHGLSGGQEVVKPFCDYLKILYEKVADLYEEGLSDYEMKEAVVESLSEYREWPGFEDQVGKHISLALLEVEQAEFE